jgi:hypothetical protein
VTPITACAVRWLQHATHYNYVFARPTLLIDALGLAPVDCRSLVQPATGSCCTGPLIPAFRNVQSRRALYCANKDKPPIQLEKESVKGWVEKDPRTGDYFGVIQPQGNACINWCICKHEEFHIDQGFSGKFETMSRNARECEAYTVHLRCLFELSEEGLPKP